MTDLSNKSFWSLLGAIHKTRLENAEAQREVAAMDHAARIRDAEWQNVLDGIDHYVHNGSMSAEARVDEIADIIFALYPHPNETENDQQPKVDGQTQIRYGRASDVDWTPST